MYYIGIDIGGTSIKAGIVNERGDIILKSSRATPTADTLVLELVSLTKELFEKCVISQDEISGVGMGIPGMADADRGVVKYSNNLKMENLSIVKDYREKIDIPTYIANDADAAALGEATFGSGKGKRNIVFITLGTGVGTGVIFDGKLLAGSEGGHIVIQTSGAPCTCGRLGCFECYASATALKRMAKEAAEENPNSLVAKSARECGISGKTAFECAECGDKVATKVVVEYLEYLANGITSLVNIFSPECVLIGGGVSNERPKYFKIVEDLVNQNTFGNSHRERVTVLPASLKNNAGILGAAALAMFKCK